MIVFKYFFKVLKKYLFMVILFTSILIFFGIFSLKTNDVTVDFTKEKADIAIVNLDKDGLLTKSLVHYLKKNAIVHDLDESELEDALFYRKVSSIFYIPESYSSDFLSHKNPKIEVKKTGDYDSSIAELLLNQYLETAFIYRESNSDSELVKKIEASLIDQVEVEMTTSLNTDQLEQANVYYNFANYSILAICIFVIATIMSSFKNDLIQKRTQISCMKVSFFNWSLFLGIMVLGFGLWVIYCLISILLLKDIMLSIHGLFYMFNCFIFMVCAVAIAFMVGTIIKEKEAISGISNVISLGSSFLCGAFVPVAYLPSSVLMIAHILPSYWYIQNNEYLKTLEGFSLDLLKPFFINIIIMILFIILFIVITNLYVKRKKA